MLGNVPEERELSTRAVICESYDYDDVLERLASTVDALGPIASYDYAGPGRLSSCTTETNVATVTSLEWDGLRRLTDADGVLRSYDDMGNNAGL